MKTFLLSAVLAVAFMAAPAFAAPAVVQTVQMTG